MNLTWRLWRTLREPPLTAHAVYKRTVTGQTIQLRYQIPQRWLAIAAAPVLLLLVLQHGVLSLLMMVFIVPALGVLAFLLLPVLLPPFTAVIGGFWAASISGALVKERNDHTYDLLCVTPSGTLAANWAVASGCLHRGDIFDSLRSAVYVALMIGGFLLGLMALVTAFMAMRATAAQSLVVAVRTIVDLMMLLGLFYLHYVQSMVLSALVGVYAPAVFENRSDTPWLAFALFEIIQFSSYIGFLLLHVVFDPLLSTIRPDQWLAFVTVPLLYLLAFIVLREAIVMWLWRVVNNRLNITPGDEAATIQVMQPEFRQGV